MIELHESTRVWSVWFVSYAGGDWMAVLLKQEAEALPSVVYRFRYDAEGEEGDTRHWYQSGVREDRPGAPTGVEAVAADLAKVTDEISLTIASLQPGARSHKVEVNGDGHRAMELIAQQPWSRIIARPEVQA